MHPDVPPVAVPVIVRPFDPPLTAYGPGHRGVDVAAVAGQEVHSMADGRVLFAGTVAGIPVITVDHGGDLRSTYEPVVATVVEGDRVRAGQAIGAVAGVGGHCGGDLGCIHVGLRQAHRYLDPTPFLTPAVLKTLRRPPEGGPAGR